MNEMLVTVKAAKIITMIRNVDAIEAEDCKVENIHAFEIINVEWLPKGMMLRRLKILEAARMMSITS